MRAARLVVGIALAVAGCKPPPPKPPPPPPPPKEEPPPPPPPKCESLDEKCVSKDDTRVAIGETGLTIAPPSGWTYARGPTGMIVVASASAIAVEAMPVSDPKKPPRAQALASVVEKLSVKFPKRKGKLDLPKKADKTTTIGALKVAFYQLDGAVRETKKGPLLVFSTNADGQLLMGAGFVAEDDTTNADAAILKAVESMSNAPPQPTPPPATPAASAPPATPAPAPAASR